MAKKAVRSPEEILGIPPGASESDIRQAYFKMARQYHPDVSKEEHAEEKFKELEEAVATLKKRTNLKSLLDLDLNDFDLDLATPNQSRVIASFGNVNLIEQRFTFEKKKPKLGSG